MNSQTQVTEQASAHSRWGSKDAPEHTDLSAEEFAAQRARARQQPQSVNLPDAIGSGPFWKVLFGLFCCGFSMNLLGTHGMPMLMDHGFDAFTSSMGIGLIGLVAIGGTLVLGRLRIAGRGVTS